jgi:hypothetical protein
MDELNNSLLNNLSVIFKNDKSVLLGFNDLNIYLSQLFFSYNFQELISIVCCFDNEYNICLVFTLNKNKKNLGLSILDIEEVNPGGHSYIQNKFTHFEVIFKERITIIASHNNRGLLKYDLKSIHDYDRNSNVLINEFEDFDVINNYGNILHYKNLFYDDNLYDNEKIFASTTRFLDVLDLNKNKLNQQMEFKKLNKIFLKEYSNKGKCFVLIRVYN